MNPDPRERAIALGYFYGRRLEQAKSPAQAFAINERAFFVRGEFSRENRLVFDKWQEAGESDARNLPKHDLT